MNYSDECHDVYYERSFFKIHANWLLYINFVGKKDRITIDAENLLKTNGDYERREECMGNLLCVV